MIELDIFGLINVEEKLKEITNFELILEENQGETPVDLIDYLILKNENKLKEFNYAKFKFSDEYKSGISIIINSDSLTFAEEVEEISLALNDLIIKSGLSLNPGINLELFVKDNYEQIDINDLI